MAAPKTKARPYEVLNRLRASNKGERKKAVAYLRAKGFSVKKRKDGFISSLYYLANYLNSNNEDFEYCDTCRDNGVHTLTLPRDWDKFVQYVDEMVKVRSLFSRLQKAERITPLPQMPSCVVSYQTI